MPSNLTIRTCLGRAIILSTYLRTSLAIAIIVYGREFLSANSGKRSRPITQSISACAFFCTSGYRTIARMNVVRVPSVYQIRLKELYSFGGSICLTVSVPASKTKHISSSRYHPENGNYIPAYDVPIALWITSLLRVLSSLASNSERREAITDGLAAPLACDYSRSEHLYRT